MLSAELRQFGVDVVREHPAGVSFEGPLASARTQLACRHVPRVACCERFANLNASDPDVMYRGLLELPWESHVGSDGTFAVDVVGESPRWLRHTQFAALRAKDAIVDRMRVHTGERPNVSLASPDLRVSLRFARERVTVGIDLSGEPLHRRGYRQTGVEAPLKENLAAALLLRSGWATMAAEGAAFYDPMCGSGTLVIEAAMIAAGIALDCSGAGSASSAGCSTMRNCGTRCEPPPRTHASSRYSREGAVRAAIATRPRSAPRLPTRIEPGSAITCCSIAAIYRTCRRRLTPPVSSW